MDPRQRRASDGVLCVVKETSTDTVPFRSHRSPLLSYKTEPGAGKMYHDIYIWLISSNIHQAHHFSLYFNLDHSFTYVDEEVDYEAKEQCRVSRNGHNRCVIVVKSNICPWTNPENKMKFFYQSFVCLPLKCHRCSEGLGKAQGSSGLLRASQNTCVSTPPTWTTAEWPFTCQRDGEERNSPTAENVARCNTWSTFHFFVFRGEETFF